MTEDGRVMYMVSSGSWDDYNLVVQKIALKLKEDDAMTPVAKYFRYPIKRTSEE